VPDGYRYENCQVGLFKRLNLEEGYGASKPVSISTSTDDRDSEAIVPKPSQYTTNIFIIPEREYV
jgi:hypothetical protein